MGATSPRARRPRVAEKVAFENESTFQLGMDQRVRYKPMRCILVVRADLAIYIYIYIYISKVGNHRLTSFYFPRQQQQEDE